MKKFNETVELLLLKSTPKEQINLIFNETINNSIDNLKKLEVEIERQDNYVNEIKELDEYFIVTGIVKYSSAEQINLNNLIYEVY